MPEEIDTANHQMVSIQGERIVVILSKPHMTKKEALLHAAWLVAIADDGNEFDKVLSAVRNT